MNSSTLSMTKPRGQGLRIQLPKLPPPAPMRPISRAFDERKKSRKKDVTFAPMEKREQGKRSFLKVRPTSPQEEVVVREEKQTEDGSALEPDLIWQASSPRYYETESVYDPPEGNVSHEESSELGLVHQTPSRHNPPTQSTVIDELEKIERENRPMSLHTSMLELRKVEERRMKEESTKKLEELQETLQADLIQQECEMREINNTILERVKTELMEEQAKTVQKLKARNQKRLDRLQAQFEADLTSEKERLQKLNTKQQDSSMQGRRESFTSVRQKVEKEQRRTLERLNDDHEKEIRKIKEKHSEDKDLLKEELLSRFNLEKEESAKELEELQETLKADRKRQELELREKNNAILERVKTELTEEQAKTVQKLKARNKKRLDHLQAQFEADLTSEKERLQKLNTKQQDSSMQGRREPFTSVRREVEQEQRRTLERLNDDHEKEIRKIKEKHSEDKDLLKEQLLSRFNQEKEQREELLALRLQNLDTQHDAEVLKRQRENSDKMLEVKKLSTELEVRQSDLERQDAVLRARAEMLSSRMSDLEEEDKAGNRNMKCLPSQTLKEDAEREKREKRQRDVTSGCQCDVSLELLQKSTDELRTCQQARENLVTVDQLQRQSDRLSSRMDKIESSSRSDVECPPMFNEKPYHVRHRKTVSPPPSSHVDVHNRARLFLKLEAARVERAESRGRESQTPSSRFLSSWSKYSEEKAVG